MGHRIRRSSLVSALLALCSTAVAQDIEVLTLAPDRAGTCGSLDFHIPTGNAFGIVRTLMLSPSAFGPSGTVPRAIHLRPSVDVISPDTLVGVDVVLVSTARGRALSAAEARDLVEFARQGGGVFAFDNVSGDDFAAGVGATASMSTGSGPVTIVDPASPLIAGPFGVVAPGIGNLNFHRVLDDAGPAGNVVLSTSGPVCTEFTVGAGRVVVVCDEELFVQGTVLGCAVGQLPEGRRQTLFLNALASVVPATGFQYVRHETALGDVICDPNAANQTHFPGLLGAEGSAVVADDDLTLVARQLPVGGFGLAICSRSTAQVPMAGGGLGTLCLGGTIGRFNAQVTAADSFGWIELPVDLGALPQGGGTVAAQPGESWTFQMWYRDVAMGAATSNFTSAVTIGLQ